MAARITRVSQRSGAPQVTIPIAAPGLATRRSSRTAATGSAANWTELKAVTVSKLSAANGSDSSIALAQIGAWEPLAGDIEQRAAGVESGDGRATLGRQVEGEPGAAARIEQRRAGPDASGVKYGLVERRALGLVELGPVTRPRSPELGLQVC